ANLDGYAVSRGISLNLESRCGTWLKVNAGISWMDVFTVAGGIQQPQLFAPDWSGTFLVGIGGMGPWTLDVSGQWSGPMALPVLPNDFRPARSPWYTILDVQVKRPIGERFEVYGGAKNILDFVPRDPLMRPFDPFDRSAGDPVSNPNGYTFDTAYIYAPLQGIRGFLGLRFVLAG
ncbi:MAG: TonB-dependent receptor, partial [Flavobacteriales bacterium]|nr:TonB-dependent receptor [Flavobacteriales bacterium]